MKSQSPKKDMKGYLQLVRNILVHVPRKSYFSFAKLLLEPSVILLNEKITKNQKNQKVYTVAASWKLEQAAVSF